MLILAIIAVVAGFFVIRALSPLIGIIVIIAIIGSAIRIGTHSAPAVHKSIAVSGPVASVALPAAK